MTLIQHGMHLFTCIRQCMANPKKISEDKKCERPTPFSLQKIKCEHLPDKCDAS